MAGVHLDGAVLRRRRRARAVGAVVGDPVLQRRRARSRGRGSDGRSRPSGVEPRTRRASSVESVAIEASRGCSPRGSGCRDLAGGAARASGGRHRASDGCGSHRWTSRFPRGHRAPAGGRRGGPWLGRPTGAPGGRPSDGLVPEPCTRPRPAAPPATAPRPRPGPRATLRLPPQVVGQGVAEAVLVPAGRPRAQHVRALHVVRAEQARHPLRQPEPTAAPHLVLARPPRYRLHRPRASPHRGARRSPRSHVPRQPVGHSTDPSSAAVTSASPTRRRGDGNSTFAQIPSAPAPCPTGGRAAARPSAPRRGWAPRRHRA